MLTQIKELDLRKRSIFRIYAVIIFDKKVYRTCSNHQNLMEEIANELRSKSAREKAGKLGKILDDWDKQDYDLITGKDADDAIEMTDMLFRQNKLFGFDIYVDENETYLVSHYASNLENNECLQTALAYAKKMGYTLGTFESMGSYSVKCYVTA